MPKKYNMKRVDVENIVDKRGDINIALPRISEKDIEKYTEIGIKSARELLMNNPGRPYNEIYRSVDQLRNKLNLSEDQFAILNRSFQNALVNENIIEDGEKPIELPLTNVSKVLGNVVLNYHKGIIVSEKDKMILDEILKNHKEISEIHSKLVLQSYSYQPFDLTALLGSFYPSKNDISMAIHPVIVALMIPKFKIIESHLIYANITNIIKTRNDKKPFVNRPDFELFYDMISDPEDVICNRSSTLLDLKTRINIQKALWNCVFKLRNGVYYDPSSVNFMKTLDTCNLGDESDSLMYGHDEYMVLRKLFSAFSLRPTMIGSGPVVNPFLDKLSTFPLPSQLPDISSVPFVNVYLGRVNEPNKPLDLGMAVKQNKVFIETNKIVSQEVMYSRDILVIYVNRKITYPVNPLQFDDEYHYSYNFNNVPIDMDGIVRINTTLVYVPPQIEINSGYKYRLTSVVLSEINNLTDDPYNNVVVGNSAMFIKHANPAEGVIDDKYLYYNPYGIIEPRIDENGKTYRNYPFSEIDGYTLDTNKIQFFNEISRRGTVFVYELINKNKFKKQVE